MHLSLFSAKQNRLWSISRNWFRPLCLRSKAEIAWILIRNRFFFCDSVGTPLFALSQRPWSCASARFSHWLDHWENQWEKRARASDRGRTQSNAVVRVYVALAWEFLFFFYLESGTEIWEGFVNGDGGNRRQLKVKVGITVVVDITAVILWTFFL